MKNNYTEDKFLKLSKHIATFNGFGEYGLFPEMFDNAKTKKKYKNYCKNLKTKKCELTECEFNELLSKNCHYCGKESNKLNENGIDRIDSYNRVYTTDNSVPCCKTCNKIKYRKSINEFLTQCSYIAYHN